MKSILARAQNNILPLPRLVQRENEIKGSYCFFFTVHDLDPDEEYGWKGFCRCRFVGVKGLDWRGKC